MADPLRESAQLERASRRLGRRKGTDMTGRPDLRTGDPKVHDLIAEIDEAIDIGDEPTVERLSLLLRELDPNAGPGGDS